VPDELHARLSAQAEREGRSVNALVVDLLSTALADEHLHRKERLRVRAVRLGLACQASPPPSEDVEGAPARADVSAVLGLDEDRDWSRYGEGEFPDPDPGDEFSPERP
jgi:plasmid stability protein